MIQYAITLRDRLRERFGTNDLIIGCTIDSIDLKVYAGRKDSKYAVTLHSHIPQDAEGWADVEEKAIKLLKSVI